jgi:hypothetical protein
MGNRTLSLSLVLRALALDSDAYDELRRDDNPFVEGLFFIVLVGAFTALLSLVGQLIAWAGTPDMTAIKDIVLQTYQQAPWWASIQGNPEALRQFQQFWDIAWQAFPALFGAPNPGSAALNIIGWPLGMLLSWLFYGVLAHLFARLLRGAGSLGQTLGLTALSFAPLLLRGLGFIPYLTLGAVLSTWQLLCRFKALRSAHELSWGRAFWATLLPFAVYLIFWLLLTGVGVAAIAALAGR